MKSWCLFQVMFWRRILGRGWVSRCNQLESRWHPHDSWALSKCLSRLFPEPVGRLLVVLPWGLSGQWDARPLCCAGVWERWKGGNVQSLGSVPGTGGNWPRAGWAPPCGSVGCPQHRVVVSVFSSVPLLVHLLQPSSHLLAFPLLLNLPLYPKRTMRYRLHSSPSCYCGKRGTICILTFGRKFLLNPRRPLILGCRWAKS